MAIDRSAGKKKFIFKDIDSKNIVDRGKGDSDWDAFITVPDVKWFKVKDNNKDKGHCFRILPPFWENATHWGTDIWIHYNIGSDNNMYLCLKKMGIGNCPVCEDIAITTDEKLANEVRAVPRVLQWLIDRDNEKEGPMLWSAPSQFDTTVCSVAVSRKTGAAKSIQNPDTGCDISFKTEGAGKHRKYLAHKCEDPSPLTDDNDKYNEWLEYVQKYPLPSILKFYDYDYIYKEYHGKSANSVTEKHVEKEETTEPLLISEKGIKSVAKILEAANEIVPHKFDYSYDQVMSATTEELDKMLDNIIQHHSVNEAEIASMDDAELKKYICYLLNLKPAVVQSQEETESPAAKLRSRFKRGNAS